MIFLKRIKAKGFKSFAHETIIDFDAGMTAIIGPNGSGKSNVVDAIKWTIGEQSIKQLRGHDKNNLIFAGTDTLPPAEEAYVEITFVNNDNFFDIDEKEIKVKRFSRPKDDESLYFINDKPAKLREIQELFLDSGLTKGNLGIISQGTVSAFSDAKPDDRKQIFHEAAGIGKYDKKKKESLSNLSKANENLQTIKIELDLIDKERKMLLKAQEKAEEYKQKSATLKSLELYICSKRHKWLSNEIDSYKEKNNEVQKELDNIKAQRSLKNELLNSYDNQINNFDLQINEFSISDNNLKTEFDELNAKYNTIQAKINNDLNSDNIEKKIKAIKEILNIRKNDLENNRQQYNEYTSKQNKLEEEAQSFMIKYNDLKDKINWIDKEIYSLSRNEENLKLQKERSQDKTVEKLLSNKSALPGLINTVGNLIEVKEEYSKAIYTALGSAVKNFVTIDEKASKDIIEFLKNNKNGYATFLPLNKILSRDIDKSLLDAIVHMKGFVGVASNLIKIDKEYSIVASHLLGNVIIADNINNAANIATALKQKIKVVTLDGDVKNPGGSITGGYKQAIGHINFDHEIKKIQESINEYRTKLEKLNVQKTEFDSNYSKYQNDKNFYKTQIDILSQKYGEIQDEINKNNNELKSLDDIGSAPTNNTNIQDDLYKIQNRISEISSIRTKIVNDKNHLESEKNNIIHLKSECNNELSDINSFINKYEDDIAMFIRELSKYESEFKNIQENIIQTYNIDLLSSNENYNNPLPELSDNQINNEIAILKNELKKLGYVDDSYLEKLEEIEQKFAQIETQYNQAYEAVEKINLSIDELDKKAKKDFKDTIKKINDFLPEIFKKFFGGGECKIELTDPSNILESGVEISIQPPGKNIINLTLLSGGEKTLVSLTILFSILKVSHFPLIILDEAEAALDEGNVHLFASMIKEFSSNNQFIIITHRPGTMAISDVLLGATMENRGITKIFKTSYAEVNKDCKDE